MLYLLIIIIGMFLVALFNKFLIVLISMATFRSPAVALMPALTPPHLRSEGNAIINLCGGAGSLVGMIAGSIITIFFNMIYGKGNFDETIQNKNYLQNLWAFFKSKK